MAGEKILIIDDEKPINDLISSYLTKQGFKTISSLTGKDALEQVKEEKPDLIILDVMLPDIDGPDLCLQIRKHIDTPILFLSCKGEELDKIIAFSSGGDDYMTKPFFPGELVARVKAHLRRRNNIAVLQQEEETSLHEFSGLTVNVDTREVMLEGQPVCLTAKEFDILQLFIENPKRIFSADQIFELIWKTSSLQGDSRTVMVYISTLRKKLEADPSNPKYILNIRGVGYKFNHNLPSD